MVRIFSRSFFLWTWASDFTLPFMSLLSGRTIGRSFQEIFGRRNIEDLRIPFACVSTNLSTRQQLVHMSGLVWLAVRASMSLPPVVPPVKTEEGLLVDGGFLNNIPVDVCPARGAGFVIAVSVSPIDRRLEDLFPDEYLRDQEMSGWTIMRRRYWDGLKRNGLSLLQIMNELNFLVNANRTPQKGANIFINVPHMETYGTFIQPSDVAVLIGNGYREAKAVLQQFRETYPELWKRIAIDEETDDEIRSIADLVEGNFPERTWWNVLMRTMLAAGGAALFAYFFFGRARK
jgi:predicted acylesterase/phospholipase RssA